MKVKVKEKIGRATEHIKNNKKKILIRYIIFISVFAIFLIIDQLTKAFVFKHGSVISDTMVIDDVLLVKNPYFTGIASQGMTGLEYVLPEQILPANPDDWLNYSIIGVRSIWHRGVTFLPDTVNIDAIQAISMIIFLFTLTVPLFSKNRLLVVTIAIISAGAMGNMLDRFIFIGYVKDLFYWPFLEKENASTGTFNFADVSVIIGAIGTIITLILEFILDFFKSKKRRKEAENEVTA